MTDGFIQSSQRLIGEVDDVKDERAEVNTLDTEEVAFAAQAAIGAFAGCDDAQFRSR
jgi:hypothetical protein